MSSPLIVLSACLLAACTSPSSEEPATSSPIDGTYLRLAEEVRQEALHSWKAYKQYAFGHDALKLS